MLWVLRVLRGLSVGSSPNPLDSPKSPPLFRMVVCPWIFPPYRPRSASETLSAWLFYDHHHRDPIAYRVLGCHGQKVTRRWFYLIPAAGDRGETGDHKIEPGVNVSLAERGLYGGKIHRQTTILNNGGDLGESSRWGNCPTLKPRRSTKDPKQIPSKLDFLVSFVV